MPRRIFIDATVATPPYAGVQLAAMQEARALSKLLPDAVVFGTAPGFTPQPCWAQNKLGRIFWQQVALPRRLHRAQAEAMFALAYTSPLHCPCPVILHVHDLIALEYPEMCSSLNAFHMRMLLPRSICHAEAIIASTQYVAERIGAHFPKAESKVHVINLGVDFECFSDPQPRLAKLPTSPYFLFVGNLEPKKGLSVLLDAFEAIASSCEANLIIVGRIAWKSASITRRIAELKHRLPGRVITLGYLPASELPSLYQHAAAFVFPSFEEGFGLPILEAMAAATPVIHSSHPALLEASGGNGLPFETGNSHALAEIMLHCLNTSDGSLLAQAMLHAKAHSWSRWAEEAIALC